MKSTQDLKVRALFEYIETYLERAGSGHFAYVYKYDGKMSALRHLMKLLKNRVGPDDIPDEGQNVVMRITDFDRDGASITTWKDFSRAARREVTLFDRVFRAKVTHPCTGKVLLGKDVVPRLYFSGTFRPLKVHFTVMEEVQGTTLQTIMLQRSTLPTNLIDSIRNAFVVTWLAGVAHNDAHAGNVMIDAETSDARLIDFGLATKIPAHAVATLRRVMKEGGCKNIDSLWHDSGLDEITKDIYYKKQGFRYKRSPNGNLLRKISTYSSLLHEN
jgi:serine/threonine protein kinase